MGISLVPGMEVACCAIPKRQTASKYLKALVGLGVLEEHQTGREKVFIHPKLMRLLTTEDDEFNPYE